MKYLKMIDDLMFAEGMSESDAQSTVAKVICCEYMLSEDEALEYLESQIEEPEKPTRWKDAIRIEKEVDGYKGSAGVMWIEDDGFNDPHWSAFISVPFKDARWNPCIGAKTQDEAVAQAERNLEYALSRCTMV